MPDQLTLTPIDHDPFGAWEYDTPDPTPSSVPTAPSLAPVGGIDFSDPITQQAYLKQNPQPTPTQDTSRSWMQDSSVPLPYRIGGAVGTSLWDQMHGLASSAWSAATLPGDVATGKVDPNSQEALERSTNLAGFMGAGPTGGLEEGAFGTGWNPKAKAYLDNKWMDALGDDLQGVFKNGTAGSKTDKIDAIQNLGPGKLDHELPYQISSDPEALAHYKAASDLDDTEEPPLPKPTSVPSPQDWSPSAKAYLEDQITKSSNPSEVAGILGTSPEAVHDFYHGPWATPTTDDPEMVAHADKALALHNAESPPNPFQSLSDALSNPSTPTGLPEWKSPYSENDLEKIQGNLNGQLTSPITTEKGTWSPAAENYLTQEAQKELQKNFEAGMKPNDFTYPQSKLSALNEIEQSGPKAYLYEAYEGHPFTQKYGQDLNLYEIMEKAQELHDKNPTFTQPVGPPPPPIIGQKKIPPNQPWKDMIGPTLPFNPSNLDLSPEARMQRAAAMGANLEMPLYRGLGKSFEDHYGTIPRNNSFSDPYTKTNEPGIFSATDPKVANAYADHQSGSQVIPMYSMAKNPKTIDWTAITGSDTYSGMRMQDQIKQAIQEGHDALHIKNIHDIGSEGPQEQYVNFNPNQLRSKFAVFDPKYKDSSNLLASKGNKILAAAAAERSRLTPVDHDPFTSPPQSASMAKLGVTAMSPEDIQNVRNSVPDKWQNAPIIDSKGNTIHPGNPDPNAEHNYSIMMDDKGKPQSGIVAYHGSTNDFDNYDLKKIGSGEGFQTEGHGLYFAQNPKVSEWYATNNGLGRGNISFPNQDGTVTTRMSELPDRWKPSNVGLTRKFSSEYYDEFKSQNPNSPIKKMEFPFAELAENSGDFEKTRNDITSENWLNGNPKEDISKEHDQEIAKALDFMQDKGVKFDPPNSVLYKNHVNVDPETLLNWNKPIIEQSPNIQNSLQKLGITDMSLSGKDAFLKLIGHDEDSYNTAMIRGNKNWQNVQKDISNRLNNIGVNGVQYLDNKSENSPELLQTKNYTIFSKKPVTILNKSKVTPVDGDPFTSQTPVDHDPFK